MKADIAAVANNVSTLTGCRSTPANAMEAAIVNHAKHYIYSDHVQHTMATFITLSYAKLKALRSNINILMIIYHVLD